MGLGPRAWWYSPSYLFWSVLTFFAMGPIRTCLTQSMHWFMLKSQVDDRAAYQRVQLLCWLGRLRYLHEVWPWWWSKGAGIFSEKQGDSIKEKQNRLYHDISSHLFGTKVNILYHICSFFFMVLLLRIEELDMKTVLLATRCWVSFLGIQFQPFPTHQFCVRAYFSKKDTPYTDWTCCLFARPVATNFCSLSLWQQLWTPGMVRILGSCLYWMSHTPKIPKISQPLPHWKLAFS